MRIKLPKYYLEFVILVFSILITFNSCEKENVLDDHIIQQEVKGIKARTIDVYEISKNTSITKLLSDFNQKAKPDAQGLSARQVSSTTYDFTIDTDTAKYIEYGSYHSYTFIVNRSIDNGFIENVLFSLQADGTYRTTLITYDLTAQEQIDINNGLPIDLSGKLTFTLIEDASLVTNTLNRNTSGNEDCYNEVVIIPAQDCSMGHPYGTGCQWEGTNHPGAPQPPLTILVLSDECFWNGTGPIDPGGDNGGGGIGDPNDPDDPNDPIDDLGGGLTSPVIENLSSERECNKIKKVIEVSNPEFMTKVRGLKDKSNLTFESSVVIFEDNSVGEYQGVENASTVQSLPTAPTSDYMCMAHVHNETESIKTYSVPSLGDLQWIATRYKDGYLNSSKFVALLATGDGTYFALTINNGTKFWKFFKYVDIWNPMATQLELEVASEDIDTKNYIRAKYYTDETNRLIKENAQGAANNEQQLKYFMQFLDDADAGITVFETDENFNSFTELILNGSNVERNDVPCQF